MEDGRKTRDWLWRATVVAPLAASAVFLSLIAFVAIFDVCNFDGACRVVMSIALWGAVGMWCFVVVSRIVVGLVSLARFAVASVRRSGLHGVG
jgi:hypothetical protein